jgi:hypothetical protein
MTQAPAKPKRVKKLQWLMTGWYERWVYQAENGLVFGTIQKSGGSWHYPYRPIHYTWFLGEYDRPGVLNGECPTQKEAKAVIERLYQEHVRGQEKEANETNT